MRRRSVRRRNPHIVGGVREQTRSDLTCPARIGVSGIRAEADVRAHRADKGAIERARKHAKEPARSRDGSGKLRVARGAINRHRRDGRSGIGHAPDHKIGARIAKARFRLIIRRDDPALLIGRVANCNSRCRPTVPKSARCRRKYAAFLWLHRADADIAHGIDKRANSASRRNGVRRHSRPWRGSYHRRHP